MKNELLLLLLWCPLCQWGKRFLVGTGLVLTSAGAMLSVPETAQAESAIYYYNRGNKKFTMKDYYGAISDYTKAVEINPNLVQPYGSMCGAKVNIGMNEEAVDDCNKALSLSSSNQLTNSDRAMIYANLCGANLNLGVHKDTIKDCTKALEFNPQNDLAFYNRGSAKIHLNDNYGAISDINQAIDLNPKSNFISWYYLNRGIAKEKIGDLQGACFDWREASYGGDQDAARFVRNQC